MRTPSDAWGGPTGLPGLDPVPDEAFRRWIRSLPCVVAVYAGPGERVECLGPVQFCHYWHRKMGGRSAPPDVGNGFPACLGHHDVYHRIWTRAFERRYRIPSLRELCRRLGSEYEQGGAVFPEEPYGAQLRGVS